MQKIESSVKSAKGYSDGIYSGYRAPRLSISQRLSLQRYNF
jgi:hypothetical protein